MSRVSSAPTLFCLMTALVLLPLVSSAEDIVTEPEIEPEINYAASSQNDPAVDYFANFDTSFSDANNLGMEFIPEYPRPNAGVRAKINFYGGDLYSADITWLINNKPVEAGKGKTSIQFTMPSAGVKISIEVKIRLSDGRSFSKSTVIQSAGVNLVFEANSIVPFFYKGKSLVGRQGEYKVVALPEFYNNGKKVDKNSLIFEWSTPSKAFQSKSGQGKDILVLNNALFGAEEEVTVVVKDPATNTETQGTILVSPVEPELLIFENNFYYGILLNRALFGTHYLGSSEIDLLAIPAFASKPDENSLYYQWSVAGASTPGQIGRNNAILLRKPESGSGEAKVGITMENPTHFMQTAKAFLTISFGDN